MAKGFNVIKPSREAYLSFLKKVFKAIKDSEGNREAVYPLLKGNLDKLDDGLVTVLMSCFRYFLSQGWSHKLLFDVIISFNELIRNFSCGDKANNVEIAVSSNQIALDIYPHKLYPYEWTLIQNNLGVAYRCRIKGHKADNLKLAIQAYKAALEAISPQTYSNTWALIQSNMGEFYCQRIKEDKAENLKLAVQACQAALKVYTHQTCPFDWARTQSILGSAYLEENKENKAENLENAIKAFQAALEVYTREDFLEKWAENKNCLGLAYCRRIRGNKANNLELAIQAHKAALEAISRQTYSYEWALVRGNLGVAYSKRIKEDKAENLELAIQAHKAALEVLTSEAYPLEWAKTQDNLGTAYNHRIKGDKAENLEKAIEAYQLALSVRTRDAFPYDWAETQNNLGTAYNNRIREDKAENLEKAIKAFQLASEVFTLDLYPNEWALVQINLGVAYFDRIKGDKAENLEEAIKAYQAALTICTCSINPYDWASIQNNLGTVYTCRIFGDKAENLELAITACKSALAVYNRKDNSHGWADVQLNLGTAYLYRVKGDKAENLEEAVKAYQAVLEVITHSSNPYRWALTQLNLGTAYLYRVKGDKAENLEEAIKAYQLALSVNTRGTLPYNWALVQDSLGAAYSKRIKEDKAENLELAIQAHKAALEVLTSEAYPLEWAKTQDNLGTAYNHRIKGDKAENLEKAIEAYQLALSVRTRDAFPYDWAETQNNLGYAYHQQKRTSEAVKAFQLALEIDTSTALPLECLRTGRNLGNAAFTDGIWDTAIQGYAAAIDAVEQIRTWATSDERREVILESAIDVYRGIIHAYINNRQLDRAIEYVERSKARNLVELLTTRDHYPKGEITEAVLNELDRLRHEIPAKQRQLKGLQTNTSFKGGTPSAEGQRSIGSIRVDTSNSTRLEQLQQDLSSLQQQLDNLIAQQIQPIDPSFSLTQKVQPISLQQIQDSLPDDQTTIVEWYILSETFLTFVITSQNVSYWSSSPEDQKNLIELTDKYLSSYRSQKNQWQSGLDTFLTDLAEILHLDQILSQIPAHYNQLILIPHRFLHLLPLHALPLPNDKDKCLLDKFERGVRYAPSCQMLQLCQDQQRNDFSHFFAIQNPTQDLSYTDIEVASIRRNFQPNDDVLPGQEAKKEEITHQRVRNTHCAHFSCHGYFNFESPLQSALLLADSVVTPAPAAPDPNRYLPLRNGAALDLKKCLTLGDLFDRVLDLKHCRLVTLSACETGMTDFASLSDEYVGLPSGFLFAGSPSVVSSLWAVNDLSTAFLMIKFYENLQTDHASVAVALNQAQCWLRSATQEHLLGWIKIKGLSEPFHQQIQNTLDWFNPDEKPFVRPYHWAAFCAMGQ